MCVCLVQVCCQCRGLNYLTVLTLLPMSPFFCLFVLWGFFLTERAKMLSFSITEV